MHVPKCIAEEQLIRIFDTEGFHMIDEVSTACIGHGLYPGGHDDSAAAIVWYF
jgi:hypothetical protein